MEPIVYVCLFFAMLSMGISLMLSDKVSHKLMPEKYTDTPTPLSTAFWYIISALMQQGKFLTIVSFGFIVISS